MGRHDTLSQTTKAVAADWLTLAQMKLPDRLGGLVALLDHHEVAGNGVVHLGGSIGEELESYIALGFKNILFVEPNPAQFSQLSAHVAFWQAWLDRLDTLSDTPRGVRIAAVCAAASDSKELVTLHLAADPGESSLCAPIPGHIVKEGEVIVETYDTDSLIADQGFAVSDFDMLVADIQGAELRALQGAPNLLKQLRMIVVEVNYHPRYSQSATEPEVDQFLTDNGYRAVLHRRATPWIAAGDTVYVRRSGDASWA